MKHIKAVLNKYKQIRSYNFLSKTCEGKYAFIGIGNHSIQNLYPVLHHLQVHMKYICCTSEKRASMIGGKYHGVKGTASITEILEDTEIRAVLVSAAASSHYKIAIAVIRSGKSLFIEKPVCLNLKELKCLIVEQKGSGSKIVTVGMQKRYSPCINILQKELKDKEIISYSLHYHTGLYPEGDELLDLFIHPIDLATFIFGKGCILFQKYSNNKPKGGATLTLIMDHKGTIGTLELSTEHSWSNAKEILSVNTSSGEYLLKNMEELTFTPKQGTVFGIPIEKVRHGNKKVEYLYERNNFNPVMVNNQIYSQGYYDEIDIFIRGVESNNDRFNKSSLVSMISTYEALDSILRAL